jgi:hypothetical protein
MSAPQSSMRPHNWRRISETSEPLHDAPMRRLPLLELTEHLCYAFAVLKDRNG